MEEYNEFVPNVHFELIPIKSLVSNQDYQRNLSMQPIKKQQDITGNPAVASNPTDTVGKQENRHKGLQQTKDHNSDINVSQQHAHICDTSEKKV